jgi:hypothetical protein
MLTKQRKMKGEVMKNLFKLLSVAVISMCLAVGCAAQKMEVKQYSGFLGDYSKLQEGPEGGVAQRYITPGVDLKQYNKIMMDQVRFYFKDDAADKGIDADDMKELADTFHRAVIEALGDAYPLVAKPGADVMRFRVAITDIDLPNRGINVISTVLPVGLAVSTVKSGVTGKGTGCGEVSMEFQMLDSQTNQVLVQGVDRRSGGKIDSMSKFGTAEEAFKFWAQRLRTGLDELHGK